MSNAVNMPVPTNFRRVEILAVLAQHDFRCLWAAYIVSHAGNAAYMFAVSRVLFDEVIWREGATAAFIAVMAPLLFMPPLAGVLADRLDRKSASPSCSMRTWCAYLY